ncbi:MAG: transcriptional repressor [Rhodospirillales bacterium]|nr:transcriptional repressor [Rhodospirillales bacterium]
MTKKEIQKLIRTLETYCGDKGLRYTPPRRITLEVIAASKRPIGAYDVIEEMGKVTDKPKPTTVYRAIEFLQEHGFIHKIESLSAFVACHAGHNHEGSQFIVCNDCGTVEEVHLCHLPKDLQKKVDNTGFKMAHWNTEIHGTCQQCQA